MTKVPENHGMEISKDFVTPRADKHMEMANDQHVRAVILYAAADDGVLFYDKANTKSIDKDELFRLFGNGILVKYNNVFYAPTSYEVESGAGKVTVNADSVSYCFYSKEKS